MKTFLNLVVCIVSTALLAFAGLIMEANILEFFVHLFAIHPILAFLGWMVSGSVTLFGLIVFLALIWMNPGRLY